MTLWRGSATPEVQADMDRLLEATSRAETDLLRTGIEPWH
jgi:hypothetical protein